VTALAAVLRFSTLDLQSFWLDEAATVEVIRHGLGGVLDKVSASESTPPLYYVLAWGWTKLFGHGEVGLRSLSALFGTAFVPAAYAAASELCSRRVGMAVAALAAVNPVLWWYSQEARAYALLALLTALGLWAFARVLNEPRSGRALAAWAVASALAMATHYFAAFLVLPQAIWLLSRPALRRNALPAVGGVVVAALALTPLALHQRSLGLAEFIAGESLAERIARAAKNMLVGFDSPLETVVAVVAALLALAGVASAAALLRGRERSGAWLAGGIGLVAVVIPLVLAVLDVDYLDTRNLLGVWLPLTIVFAAGLAATRWGRVGIVALCLLGLLSIAGVLLTPAWQRDDWRGIAEALGPPDGTRALIIQPASGAAPLRLYFPRLQPMPEVGESVKEIALVTPARRDVGGEHPKPPPTIVPPQVPGFEVAARRQTSSYALVLLRAQQLQPLRHDQAAALAFRPGEPVAIEEEIRP
jgi:4-amino-4-deoxy-L-arabinose transferase-like glycosyltransferase